MKHVEKEEPKEVDRERERKIEGVRDLKKLEKQREK